MHPPRSYAPVYKCYHILRKHRRGLRVVGLGHNWKAGAVAERCKEIQYLRRKAKQFRELAAHERRDIAQKLLDIAHDLERRAGELEDHEP